METLRRQRDEWDEAAKVATGHYHDGKWDDDTTGQGAPPVVEEPWERAAREEDEMAEAIRRDNA